MNKQAPTKYVIECEPYRPEPEGSLFYDLDGKQVRIARAAEFSSRREAERFAEAHRIELGDLRRIVPSPKAGPIY